jgi:opacity protein-like surface antigen
MSSNLTFNADNDIDNVKISWTGNLVGRLGYAFGNNLIYGKAGLAAAKINAVGGDVNGGNLTLSDAHIRDDIFYGPTAGIGYERFFGKAWIARIEYTYSDFGDYSQANQDGAPGSQVYQIENGPYQTVSFGLAYQF